MADDWPPHVASLANCVTSPCSCRQVQIGCYYQLWNVSRGNRADGGFSDESDEDVSDFSITALASAMFLMLSLAAADLWGAAALLVETRTPRFCLRRAFGLALLISFIGLFVLRPACYSTVRWRMQLSLSVPRQSCSLPTW